MNRLDAERDSGAPAASAADAVAPNDALIVQPPAMPEPLPDAPAILYDVLELPEPHVCEAEVARQVALARDSGTADGYRAKRRWPRYHHATQMELRAVRAVNPTPMAATMHSISGGGVAVLANCKLHADEFVAVREWSPDESNPWLPGYVVYCAPGMGCNLIGIAFEHPLADEPVVAASAEPAGADEEEPRGGGVRVIAVTLALAAMAAAAWWLLS